ncbi:MAG TPA: sigma factor, partial [Candidatus Eremiobacteraceae bacterium]|nr:sigma factor [Candidatus Eremiobacteraceae bacterium]
MHADAARCEYDARGTRLTQSEDEGLIQRLIDGDPAALEDAYRSHAARCRAIAWRVLRDDSLAQDAVQDAFVALWRHRDGLVVRAA